MYRVQGAHVLKLSEVAKGNDFTWLSVTINKGPRVVKK